jgi:hypothetical protein
MRNHTCLELCRVHVLLQVELRHVADQQRYLASLLEDVQPPLLLFLRRWVEGRRGKAH